MTKKKKYIMKHTEKEIKEVIDDLITWCRHNKDCTNCIMLYIYDIDVLNCQFIGTKRSYDDVKNN